LDPELQALRERALRMGALAEAILAKAWRAIRDVEPELAVEIRHDDLEIDRLDVEIDEQVLKILALQAPLAHDLRQVIAVKTMATDLERVGDLARNIAACAVRLAEGPREPLPPAITQLADETIHMLRDALDAFADLDPEKARRVIGDDDRVDEDEARLFAEVLRSAQSRPEALGRSIELILVGKHLERVADHATNIAEDVVLVTRAENLKHAAKLAGVRDPVTRS
jgi:phosphate transport system protein